MSHHLILRPFSCLWRRDGVSKVVCLSVYRGNYSRAGSCGKAARAAGRGWIASPAAALDLVSSTETDIDRARITLEALYDVCVRRRSRRLGRLGRRDSRALSLYKYRRPATKNIRNGALARRPCAVRRAPVVELRVDLCYR